MTVQLITGAAGLLGAEIAGALADRGHGVIGLVRRDRPLLRGDRQPVLTTAWRGEPPPAGTVAIVAGDVRDPHLGLGAEGFARLAAQIDGVVHCAAIVQFDAARADYEAVNIFGTRHAIGLAQARPGKPAGFIQVSTAYVCGQSDGAIAEDARDSRYCFANDYEASKFAAERLVRRAMAAGLPAAIARPSVVVGARADGAIAGFDTIYQAFRLLAEGRLRTIPATPLASLNFVPIDHVVKGIATMAERIGEAAGRAYHLVASQPISVPDFFALIGDYPQFASPRLALADNFDPAELTPMERRLHRRVATLYSSYFQRNPLFCIDNAQELLGEDAPVADKAMMRRQIDYAVRSGFLAAEPALA